jgi:hypothetical protein
MTSSLYVQAYAIDGVLEKILLADEVICWHDDKPAAASVTNRNEHKSEQLPPPQQQQQQQHQHQHQQQHQQQQCASEQYQQTVIVIVPKRMESWHWYLSGEGSVDGCSTPCMVLVLPWRCMLEETVIAYNCLCV